MTVKEAFQGVAKAARGLRDRLSSTARSAGERADALVQAIENKDFAKMQVLLSPGLKTIFNKDIAPLHPDTAFKTALEMIGELDATIFRQRYPTLYKTGKTTPLSLAAMTGFYAGAELLIEKGAKIFEEEARVKTGYSGALGTAIFCGDVKMITLLMNHDSVKNELESKPAFRNYLLHTAAAADNAASLKAIADCDPHFMEKARAYGTMKASDFTLGEGMKKRAMAARQAARG